MALNRVLLLAVALYGCGGTEDPVRRESTAMGTFVSVTLYDEAMNRDRAQAVIDSLLAEIRRIESVATDYSDSSIVGQINGNAGVRGVAATPEIAGLIREATVFSARSGGAFDITVGPLVRVWNFTSSDPRVPSPQEIDSLLPLVNYRLVQLSGDSVFLPFKGMRLDLGAIAKGYAVDRALRLMRRLGVKNGIVDLGGNLGVSWEGTRLLDSTRATIFVRHPRREGEMFGYFEVGTAGVSTSGDYQRFFLKNSLRYHHILDPHSGLPVSEVVSVTVIAPDAMQADALSTTVFVLGRSEGMKLIEQLPDVEGVIVYEQADTLAFDVSSGLEGRFFPVQPRD